MVRLRVLFGLAAIVALAPSAACDDDTQVPAAPTPPVEVKGEGARVAVTLDPFELVIADARGNEVLRTMKGGDGSPYGAPAATHDDGLDNVKVIPGWDGYAPDERPWTHGAKATVVAKTDASASFELVSGGTADRRTIVLDVLVEGSKVSLSVTAKGESTPGDAKTTWNKTSIAFALRPDEHFFGLGERYATVDHRNVSMYSWAEEGGAGKGENAPFDVDNPSPNGPSMTYFPVPFFHSSAGYAMHLATTYRTETHFGSERGDAFRVVANTAQWKAVVYVHDDPLASLDDFTRDTGRPFVPATWVFGPRRRVSFDNKVGDVEEYKMLRLKKVPTTGVDDAVHFLPARSELGREQVLREWTTSAHAWGYKVMAYNNPYVSTSKPEAASDLAYGKDHGLFAMTPEGTIGETFFISGEPQTLATIDLTKPEAVAWFQGLLRRTLALGYDGWMHDFGEYVRRPWRFGDGRIGEAVHNEFPVLSAKAAHDLMVKERGDDFLFFVRSGYTGTQQYVPAVWSGDPEASFDETQGMPAMLRGGLNLGLSGVPLWGSDLTGFKCLTDAPHDKEMYLRWAEVGAVSPIMMEQNACANPLGRREKWKLWNDDETIAVYGAMARLHTRLAPYFDVLAREANKTGAPIMRHPFLLHPREPEAWKADSSFYLGPSLFTSPVVRRGVTVKDTWLPPGKWVDFDDYGVYEGGRRVSIPAPLGKLPLLVRDGGIVPLLDPSVETLAPATEPSVVSAEKVKDRLDVIAALSPGASAHIVLADGTDLVARRKASGGAESGLASVAPEQVATCEAGCVNAAPQGGVDRLRITTPSTAAVRIAHDDVEIEVKSSPLSRRFRFDVLRIR
jgi:alpha-glucosidase (family GH31 glycosyl hydrolase)